MPKITMEKANIRQNVKLYEDALKRHGQFCRWYRSSVCYCVDEMGKAEPTCKECKGRAYIYEPISSIRRVDNGVGGGRFYIETKGNIKSINRIFGNNNVDISYDSFIENIIKLSGIIKSGKYWHCDYEEDLKESYSGSATYEGRGIIRVPIVGHSTLRGDFIGELLEITSVTNETRSEEMNVISFWEDLILTDSYAEETDEITAVCKYIKPLEFLISGISQKQRYESSFVVPEADMQLTVPGYYYIGQGDIITQLKAEQLASVAGNGNGEFHALPFFHVRSIISIRDKFGKIEDVIIVRNNEIKWGARVPEKFSINLTYNPSYAVLADLPQLRYAENKVLPRKVMLKQWDLYSRGRKKPSSIGMNQEEMIY